MSEPESRLAAVESWVGHADRDLSDLKTLLRAQTSLMQALRIEQVAMNRVLGEQGVALGALVVHAAATDDRFDAIDQKLAEHDRRFDAVDQRFEAVDQRFEAVDQKLDEILRRLPATG